MIDLANGRITGPLTITAGSVGYNNLTDKPDLTGYLTKSEFKVTADQIRAEVGRANQTAGGTKAQLDAFQQQTQQNVNNLLSRQATADDKIYRLQTAGFISRAEGNALYASAQLANGDTIASYITQSPSAINLISQNISLTGRAEFKSLQSQLNTQSDKLSNQQSQINQKQGRNDTFNLDNARLNGQTVIEGGLIKTSLIDTKNLVVKQAAAIGGFDVQNGILTSLSYGESGEPSVIGIWAQNNLRTSATQNKRLATLIQSGKITLKGVPAEPPELNLTNGNTSFDVSIAPVGGEWLPRVRLKITNLPHVNTVKNESGSHNFRVVKIDTVSGLLCWE